MGQVRNERKWFVGPTGPGIGAESTGQPDRARPRPPRARGSACVVLSLGRIRADHDAVDLQTLEPSRVLDKTLITFFVDLDTEPVIVVGQRCPAKPAPTRCELRHCVAGVCEATLRERKVTARLLSVKSMEESSVADPDRPSVSSFQRFGTRIDGLTDELTRPIGVSLIPPTDRGQVTFTPSAGGVT